MYLARLTSPNSVLPLIDTLVVKNQPRSLFVVDDQVRSCPSGSLTENRYLNKEGAVYVGTYDAGVDAKQLYEDILASLPQKQHLTGHKLVLGCTRDAGKRMAAFVQPEAA
ncbi:MAG: hypothetical protein PHD37_06735 [Gallionellaceae bacterium]|nr:hypothetical protein [Gallionellaceae bacterium]